MGAVVTLIAVAARIRVRGHPSCPIRIADHNYRVGPINAAGQSHEKVTLGSGIGCEKGSAGHYANLRVGSGGGAIGLIHGCTYREAMGMACRKAGIAVEMVLVGHARSSVPVVVGGSPVEPGVIATGVYQNAGAQTRTTIGRARVATAAHCGEVRTTCGHNRISQSIGPRAGRKRDRDHRPGKAHFLPQRRAGYWPSGSILPRCVQMPIADASTDPQIAAAEAPSVSTVANE